jgi:hypothetical protein
MPELTQDRDREGAGGPVRGRVVGPYGDTHALRPGGRDEAAGGGQVRPFWVPEALASALKGVVGLIAGDARREDLAGRDG